MKKSLNKHKFIKQELIKLEKKATKHDSDKINTLAMIFYYSGKKYLGKNNKREIGFDLITKNLKEKIKK